MVHALQNGGHVEVTGSDVSGEKECAQNDVEVLERQLQRLQRWQNMAEEFKKDDIEDVEQVVSAIERHINHALNTHEILNKCEECLYHANLDSHLESDTLNSTFFFGCYRKQMLVYFGCRRITCNVIPSTRPTKRLETWASIDSEDQEVPAKC
ncbi:hypothetical protein CAPTEDRAFT_212953 [Capitella teleta]|uniref:Uncharacterized protein n=1 Tax=Capitella teleta TaxID=283909 RepID=R7UHQ0_CAPTE|nr:hypothetical protein CAPTEDRAFT_212953 [Capitella teleta]|eukprot:ELU02807.1 hypothetical protein CAPTEDRAFT_212953 [Capitella teleta]